MSREAEALATVEQVRAMADGAHDIFLDALNEAWDDPEHPATDRLPLAIAAFRFAAEAARVLGDASLFESIADAFSLYVAVEYEDFPGSDEVLYVEATAELLALQPRLSERTIELAADSSADVRRAIATGLQPRVPGAPALLRKLAADVDPLVREAARGSLGDTEETPWWTGMLSADPASVLGEAKAARIRPALDEVLAKLNARAIRVIAPLAQELPPVIAADVAAHAVALAEYPSRDCIEPLMKLVLAGPNAEATLERLVTQWSGAGSTTFQAPVATQIAALPPKRRAQCCLHLARYALAAPEEERLYAYSPATLAGHLAGDAWPEKLDYGFVLDAIDAIDALERDGTDEDRTDFAVHAVADLLDHAAPQPKHLPRLVSRFVAPPSKTWRENMWSIAKHLEKLDAARLRPIAEKAAATRDPHVVQWGLVQLASKARRKGDPRVEALVAAWVADGRLRNAVARSIELRGPALPFLREMLRAGELDSEAAVETILAVGNKHGGLAGRKSEAASGLAITEEEWTIYRSIRDSAAFTESYEWFRALQAIPPGPRHPADRALFHRAIEATRSDRDKLICVTQGLHWLVDEESLADATALLAVVQGDDRDSVEKLRKRLADELGVPLPPEIVASAEGAAAPLVVASPRAPARKLEWMDEPDE